MILMYHKVAPTSPTMWWVEVDQFYRQMWELQNKQVVYLDDYNPQNESHIVITFDGIYRNVLEYAAPIMKQFGYPFELFLTSDYIGKDNSFDTVEPLADFTTEDELVQLTKLGGRLQWHTRSHINLKETTEIKLIQHELDIPVEIKLLDPNGFSWFAYPHGEFNDSVIHETKRFFRGAVSCIQGNDSDPYQFNRVTVTNNTSFRDKSIAVIIASYNYGSFLVEAVESVLRQTIPPDEILISDDHSSDNTQDIAQEYQRMYPDLIKYNRNEQNLGIVKHFNKAVSLTNSDLICFLGADNRFRSDYIEKTAAALMSADNIGIAYTDFALFGPRAKVVYEGFLEERQGPIKGNFYTIEFPDFNDTAVQLLHEGKNFIHGSSMYAMSAFNDVGGYVEESSTPEDYNLFFRMIKKGWHAKRVGEPLLEYRQHSTDQANIKMVSHSELKFYKEQYTVKNNEIIEKDKYILWQTEQMQEKDKGIEWLREQVIQRDNDITWLKDQLLQREEGITWLQNELVSRDEKLVSLEKAYASLQSETVLNKIIRLIRRK